MGLRALSQGRLVAAGHAARAARDDERSVVHPWYAALAVLWGAAIVSISSIPRTPVAARQPLVEHGLNGSHFIFYAVLAALVARALSGRPPGAGIARPGLVTFIVVAIFAVADEWHQSMVPGRSASMGDLVVDLAGLCAALLLRRAAMGRGARR